MQAKTRKRGRTGLFLGIVGAVAVVCILAFLIHRGWPELLAGGKKEEGALVKMMGIKGTTPEKLDSYEKAEGMLHLQHWKTEKGVDVYFVHVPTLPMVDIEVVFDAGAARNGEKGGLAYLTNKLLAEGTAHHNADQIAEIFDRVGANYGNDSYRDMGIVQIRSLSDPNHLMPALEILAEFLAKPTFPDKGLAREKANAITQLKQQQQTPDEVATRAFYNAMYPNQPYSNWLLGDEASIQALTVQDLVNFHRKFYVAQNSDVVVVGNVTAQDADAIAQTLTNNLPAGQKAPALPDVDALRDKTVTQVDFPSAQTHILMGMPVIKRGDPEFYPLYVGNHILGGNNSGNRIFNTIRNQYGLAYSAYSYFAPMRVQGPYILGCQTRNEQAAKAQELMQKMLQQFIDEGPTEEELVHAKKNLLGGYALQFDSNLSILREVASLAFYDLPLDYFDQFKPKVEQTTVADIKDAYRKKIFPDKIAVVMVGGKAKISTSAPVIPTGGPAGSPVGTDKDCPSCPPESDPQVLRDNNLEEWLEDEDDWDMDDLPSNVPHTQNASVAPPQG